MRLQLLLLITASAVLPTTRAALILYTAECDTTFATDQMTSDGSQNGTFVGDSIVNTDPAFGAKAYGFDGTSPFDNIDPGITHQGSVFTLAAFLKQGDVSLTRLFSDYIETDSPNGYLIFDSEHKYNAGDRGANEIRFTLNNRKIYENLTSDPGYATTINYQDAATYDNGPAGSGVVSHSNALFFDEDFGGTAEENLRGSAADTLVYDRAMTATEIENLATQGAAAVIPELAVMLLGGLAALAGVFAEPASMLLVGLAGLAAVFALRRRA